VFSRNEKTSSRRMRMTFADKIDPRRRFSCTARMTACVFHFRYFDTSSGVQISGSVIVMIHLAQLHVVGL
jgi:hypothetical protein